MHYVFAPVFELNPMEMCVAGNIVMIYIEGKACWILIDLDASCTLGALAGQKVTSSAFFPPEMARRELDKLKDKPESEPETVVASKQFEMWYIGLLLLQLCTVEAPTLWPSTQGDNMVEPEDMQSLAYFWDTLKLRKLGKIKGKQWRPAADLALWLLQGKASRRPESMQDVLAHRFFSADGNLRYFESIHETMDGFVERKAEQLTASINARNSDAVKEMFEHGGVHLKMLDGSISGSTVTPIMRAAFVGHRSTVEVILDEINDSWPDEVQKEYLDQRTSLNFTAYMIACARGHEEIAELLKKKGCDVSLVNTSGENGAALLQASRSLGEDSTIASLESYLALLDQKIVVMSCPETGTLKPDGSAPFDQKVMDKVSELVKRGVVKLGFDRAGTSTAVQTEEENRKWSIAFDGTLEVTQVGGAMRSLGLESTEIELQDMVSKLKINTNGFTVKSGSGGETTILAGTIGFLDYAKIACELNKMLGEVKSFSDEYLKAQFWECARATPVDVKKQIFKLTEWWNGYQSSVKAIVKIESQGFGGTLNVTCIEGGPITQLEAAEMPRIMEEAKSDCSMSGIAVRYQITKMSYRDFVAKYEHEPGDRQQAREVANYEAGEMGDNAGPDVHTQLAEARAQLAAAQANDEELASVVAAKDEELAAKDEELAAKDEELAAKDEELAAKDEELKQLRAQLERLEGVPPQRPDKDVQ
jgi:hypothetical protein